MFLITDEKFQWRIGTGVLKKGSSRKDRSGIDREVHSRNDRDEVAQRDRWDNAVERPRPIRVLLSGFSREIDRSSRDIIFYV